jgi:hypothetical protein
MRLIISTNHWYTGKSITGTNDTSDAPAPTLVTGTPAPLRGPRGDASVTSVAGVGIAVADTKVTNYGGVQ